MTVFTASTSTDFTTDLKLAQAGDTIQLNPGTYSGIYVANLNTSNVTITSADANNKAVLTDMTLNAVSGLNFSNLEMTVAKDAPYVIYGSSNISFNNIDMHGSLDGNPNDDLRGMVVRLSSNVTITNSHFHELGSAIQNDRNTTENISNNLFDVIANDGVISGGTSNITISNNVFTNWYNQGWTVHPDAIQFYTTNMPSAASNITIEGNVINRGEGTAIQGIFIADDMGNLPFQNVTIDNNVVVGESYQSINVTHATNASITNNMVVAQPDQGAWIATTDDPSVYMADNLSTQYTTSNSTVNQAGGDVLAAPLSAADAQTFSQWLESTMTSGHITDAASQAAQQLIPHLSISGYVDGASTTGKSYDFAVTNVYGTNNGETLKVAAIGSSHVYGLGGGDNIYGNTNGHASILEGGDGNDYYRVYQSQDTVIEQANQGTDAVFTWANYTMPANVEQMYGEVAGLTLTGNNDNNTFFVAAGADTVNGMGGDDLIYGGTGADILSGGDGNDKISGADGNDYLDGGAGNDSLYGQGGDDTLIGGAGADTLSGGLGKDTLTGGAGQDYFNYSTADFASGTVASNMDTITDFSAADKDIINLVAVDANSSTTADEAFKFMGTAAFDGKAGELRYVVEGDGLTLYGDTDGDKVANIAIHLSGLTTIASSSLWL